MMRCGNVECRAEFRPSEQGFDFTWSGTCPRCRWFTRVGREYLTREPNAADQVAENGGKK